MKKGTLAILEFEKFAIREGRIPTREEFQELGYCRSSYFRAKADYMEKMLKEEMQNVG